MFASRRDTNKKTEVKEQQLTDLHKRPPCEARKGKKKTYISRRWNESLEAKAISFPFYLSVYLYYLSYCLLWNAIQTIWNHFRRCSYYADDSVTTQSLGSEFYSAAEQILCIISRLLQLLLLFNFSHFIIHSNAVEDVISIRACFRRG